MSTAKQQEETERKGDVEHRKEEHSENKKKALHDPRMKEDAFFPSSGASFSHAKYVNCIGRE